MALAERAATALPALARLDRRLREMRPWSAPWVLVCAIPAIVLVSIWTGSHWISYTRLLLSGVRTQGVVSAVHCGRHAAIEYRFAGREGDVTARAKLATLGEKCSAGLVGRRIAVTFLPDDPQTSVPTENVARLFASELLLVAALGALGFAGEALVLRVARNRPPSTVQRGSRS